MVNIRRARLADAGAIADVYVETWHDTYAGIIPDPILLGLTRAGQTASWARHFRAAADPGQTLVATDKDDAIVAFGNCGRSSGELAAYTGEVFTLYVAPDAQGRGVGRALLAALFGGLHEGGMNSALVWVLADNPARFFYHAMGGALIATRNEPFHGVELSAQAYGWPDIGATINAPASIRRAGNSAPG